MPAGARLVGTALGEPPFSRLTGGAWVVLALPPVLTASTPIASSPEVVMLEPATVVTTTVLPLPFW